jgi:hypothetical protein
LSPAPENAYDPPAADAEMERDVADRPRGFATSGGSGWDEERAFGATRVTSGMGGTMAARKTKKKATRKGSGGGDLIISKSRTKAAVKKCNVGGDFYGALDAAVRGMIKEAEARAIGNKRKTLKPVDL